MATNTKTGVYVVGDLLKINNVNISEFGEDTVADVLRRDLAFFNQRVVEMLGQIAEPITTLTKRISRYGTSVKSDMVEADEFGQPTAQRAKPGVNVGWPLRKYVYAVGWTRDYMLNQTPADAAISATSAQSAYLERLHEELRKAVFFSANYSFVDRFVDELSLPVKRWVNADGAEIPDGPNGESFDGATHTHFLFSGSLTNAAMVALIDTVTEHGHTRGVRLYINKGQETTMRGLTDFEPYVDPRVTFRATDTAARTLDLSNSGNRAIGIFKEAEVWVKPWVPSNYQFCFALGSGRPLKFRQHHVSQVRGLRIAFEMDDYPLRANELEAYFGFGAWERTNGAANFSNGGSYTDPTIT